MNGKALTRVRLTGIDQLCQAAERNDRLPHPHFWNDCRSARPRNVKTTLADVQMDLRTPIKPLTALLHSLESALHRLKFLHPHRIDTALLFHHTRGRPFKPGLVWFPHKSLQVGRIMQDRGPDMHACIGLLKAKGPVLGSSERTMSRSAYPTVALAQSRLIWRMYPHGDRRPQQPRHLARHVGDYARHSCRMCERR